MNENLNNNSNNLDNPNNTMVVPSQNLTPNVPNSVPIPNQNTNMNQTNPNPMPSPKKNNTLVIVLIAVMLVVIVGAILLFTGVFNKDETPNKENETNNTEEKKEEEEITPPENNDSTTTEEQENNNTEVPPTTSEITKISQANVKGTLISFPATKESFKNTGWVWDENYAKKDLATGYTTSGGRIGTYPGGVVVSVINNSGTTKKIEDCVIDDAYFYNPKDGSEDVTFIGGITYSSKEKDVKSKMASLGFKNPKISNYDKANYYEYYLDDDQNNFKDYIQFYFYDGVLNYVAIITSGV